MDANTKDCILGAFTCVSSVVASVSAIFIAHHKLKRSRKNDENNRRLQQSNLNGSSTDKTVNTGSRSGNSST